MTRNKTVRTHTTMKEYSNCLACDGTHRDVIMTRLDHRYSEFRCPDTNTRFIIDEWEDFIYLASELGRSDTTEFF